MGMPKEIRSWAEKSHDRDDGNDIGVYVQIKGHRVWLNTSEAEELRLKVQGAERIARGKNR